VTRRPLLKRACLWTAAVVLLLAGYVQSAPLFGVLMMNWFPAAHPLYKTVYGPLIRYIHSDLPGARTTGYYCAWCEVRLQLLIDR
jgi:hypothetical protein